MCEFSASNSRSRNVIDRSVLENIVVTTVKGDVQPLFVGHTEDAHFNPTPVIYVSWIVPPYNHLVWDVGTPQHDRNALTESDGHFVER